MPSILPICFKYDHGIYDPFINHRGSTGSTPEMTQLTYEDLATSKLAQLIGRKESFEVVGLGGKLLEAVKQVENKIEVTGMTCRVYTAGRIGLAAGSFAGGITGALGVLTATGIALHNLMTLSPDYEIEKYPTFNRLVVRYKKKK